MGRGSGGSDLRRADTGRGYWRAHPRDPIREDGRGHPHRLPSGGRGADRPPVRTGLRVELQWQWELPSYARFLERLASFSRLIVFDKRGTGLSDRVAEMPNLETRMDDVRAVMDAVGSERAALCGYSEAGPMCALFAATYPARTSALVLIGSFARLRRSADHSWGPLRR